MDASSTEAPVSVEPERPTLVKALLIASSTLLMVCGIIAVDQQTWLALPFVLQQPLILTAVWYA